VLVPNVTVAPNITRNVTVSSVGNITNRTEEAHADEALGPPAAYITACLEQFAPRTDDVRAVNRTVGPCEFPINGSNASGTNLTNASFCEPLPTNATQPTNASFANLTAGNATWLNASGSNASLQSLLDEAAAQNRSNASEPFDPVRYCEDVWWAMQEANRSQPLNVTNATNASQPALPPPTPPPAAPALALPSFLWVCGLELRHGATAVRGPDGDERLRLTSGGFGLGTVWHESKQFLADGFVTEFQFRTLPSQAVGTCSAHESVGGGGLAFVIHDDPRLTLAEGCSGSGLGFAADLSYASACATRIVSSFAVSFQTHGNNSVDAAGAPGGALSSVAMSQTQDERGYRSETLAAAELPDDHRLDDAELHVVRVQYIANLAGQLTVFVDDMSHPVLSVAGNLAAALDAGGHAFVGFTASSGMVPAEHELTRWNLTVHQVLM
jgi:hypothetical protein